ncbi:hypothetical protein RYX36_009422, partial [Vicia faba]
GLRFITTKVFSELLKLSREYQMLTKVTDFRLTRSQRVFKPLKFSSSHVRVINIFLHKANRVAHRKEHVREKSQTSYHRTKPWFPF